MTAQIVAVISYQMLHIFCFSVKWHADSDI